MSKHKLKALIFIFLTTLLTTTVRSAIEVNKGKIYQAKQGEPSKWAFNFSAALVLNNNYGQGNDDVYSDPHFYALYMVYYSFRYPPVKYAGWRNRKAVYSYSLNASAEYSYSSRLHFTGGLELDRDRLFMSAFSMYAAEYEDDYQAGGTAASYYRNYFITSSNYFLGLKLGLKYYFDKNQYYFSLSNLNSFLLGKANVVDETTFQKGSGKYQSTIYQSYLCYGLGLERSMKKNPKLSWFLEPEIQASLVNYDNYKKYNIGRYPNAFYWSQWRVNIGIAYKL
jgi:hypothetical protein